MSDQFQKAPTAPDAVTPPPLTAPSLAQHPRGAARETRRPSGGVYDWLIPVILIFLALVLASIIIASVGALMGVWPVP